MTRADLANIRRIIAANKAVGVPFPPDLAEQLVAEVESLQALYADALATLETVVADGKSVNGQLAAVLALLERQARR